MMMKERRSLKGAVLCLACAVLAVVLAGCGGEPASEEGGVAGGLVVALKPDKDPDAMLAEREALGAWLSESLEVAVRVIVPASGAVIEQGLANGTIDLAWVSSTSLARYREAGIADLLVAGVVDGETWYQSYWVTLSEKSYASIEELRGQPVCFASPTSTSGYIIPAHDLAKRGLVTAEAGLESFFGEGNVLFGTGYVSAIQRVLNGQAEAAAVSDYVMDGDRHLTAEDKQRLRIVQNQGPVPTHCMAVRESLGDELKTVMKATLLALNESNPSLRSRVFGARLVEVDTDAHLDPIRQALDFVRDLKTR